MALINGASLICFAATLAATAVTVAGRQDTINLFDLARQLDDVSERALPQLRQGVLDDVTADLQQLEDELSGLLQEDLESIYAVSQAAVANVIEAKHTAIREQVEGIYGPVVTTIDEELQSMTSQSAMEDGLSIATTEAAVLAANTAAATHYHQRIKTASAFGGACENAFAVERAAVQETISSTMTQLTGKIKEQTTEVFSVSARKKAMAGPAPDDAVNWAVKLFVHLNQGCDNCEILSMSFSKQKADSMLWIRYNGNNRCIGNGHTCNWFFRVDGQDCRAANGNGNGQLSAQFHGSNYIDLHRDFNFEGVCMRTTSAAIMAGPHIVSMHVAGNGDAYTGWASHSQLTVKEIPIIQYQV